MPTIEENRRFWGREYDWSHEGEAWSAPWGSTEALWWGSLFPRIRAFVPAPTILEIAPGFGRFTHYLRSLADRLVVVDLNEACIEACEARFADSRNIEYHVNDGLTLPMVEDGSVDFAFSFDSLVHADAAAVESYVRELARTLSPDGIAFLHHSNVGTRVRRARPVLQRLPGPVRVRAAKLVNDNWRGEDMTAARFVSFCEEAGLRCPAQELVEWAPPRFLLTDCISTCTRPGSRWDRPHALVRHRGFLREARELARRAALYGAG
jgi:SAM-dependent methyltransferase